MSSNERNWLIRTTQNQILGPVQKSKVVEFIQKGALGLSDEVSSGNGYWFHLREKELVEKYLFGDIPQSYNPISEAKSTLKQKANPDKTTSINTAPANATQVIKLSDLNLDKGAAPKNEDLEYPDITVVNQKITLDFENNSPSVSSTSSTAQANAKPAVKPTAPIVDSSHSPDEIKLPSQDDLEFPDLGMVSQIAVPDTKASISTGHTTKVNTNAVTQVLNSQTEDTAIIPNSDDLEYPDMDFIQNVKKKAEEEIEVKFDVPKVELGQNSLRMPNKKDKTEPEIKLEILEAPPKTEEKPAVKEVVSKIKENKEPAKLLHERKVKPSVAKVDNKAPDAAKLPREIAPELKNRNDSYLFIVLIVLIILIISVIFYYYRFILNKPIPV